MNTPQRETVGGTMYEIRQAVAEFAATYPTPNVLRAVALAETGVITWEQAYTLFHSSLVTALVEVSA